MSDPFFSMSMLGEASAADELSSFDALAALSEWAKEWGPKVTDAIKSTTPVAADGGGALQDSITFGGAQAVSGGVSMQWTTDKFYAPFLIDGTRAHGPASSSVMRWFSGGSAVFAKWVAGIEPDTWPLVGTVEDLLPAMTESLAELFEEF
jgi:hypothetical protein